MRDEYRIAVHTEPFEWTYELEQELGALLRDIELSAVSLDDDPSTSEVVFAYAASEEKARWVLEELPQALNRDGVTVNDAHLDRWNPGEQRWQHPSLPVSEALPEPLAMESQLDTCDWEVHVHSPVSGSLRQVRQEVVGAGYLCVGTGGRRLSVLADDSGEAQELVDRIRLELPPGSETEPRRLTRRRRWLLKELIGQTYGPSGS